MLFKPEGKKLIDQPQAKKTVNLNDEPELAAKGKNPLVSDSEASKANSNDSKKKKKEPFSLWSIQGVVLMISFSFLLTFFFSLSEK